MAEVVLKITGDNTSAENALNETANTLSGVSTTAKKTSTDIKKGLDEVAASAKKANEEMSNPKPTENQKKVLNATQQLKKEIKEFEAAAVKAGEGTAEFARNIALAGQKKAQLKDLKEAISALDPDAVAKSFLGLASSVAGAFTVAQSAIALTGSKSEELEKTLIKVQAAQGLLAGLQQLANTGDELAKVKIIALNKLNTLQINLQAAAESKNIVVKKAATVAQYALNAAMKLGGSGVFLLIGGIATLVTIITKLIPKTESATEKQERLNKEFEKTKDLTNSLISTQDSYVELLKEQGKSQEEIDKARSASLALRKNQLSEEARINQETLEAFQKQLKDQLEEQKENDYLSLRADIKTTKDKIDELKNRGKELALQFTENAIKAQIEEEKDRKDREQKAKQARDKQLQLEKDFLDSLKSLRDKARSAEIQSLTGSERIEAERKINQEAIDEFEKSLIEKGKLANSNFKLTEEQQAQFGIIRNQIDKEANDKLLNLQKDFYEKAKQDQEAANEEETRIASEMVDENLKSIEEANKAKILLTKEGSKERLDAEIKAIEEERDFRLSNFELSKDQEIIIQQEAAQKILDLQKDFQSKNKFDIFKLLGINISDADKQKVQASLQSIANSAKQIIDQELQAEQEALDKRKQINDQLIEQGNNRVSELQKQLELELRLNEQGLANNSDLVRQQIADEMAARQAALEEQKRIAEEQEKIKRRQAVVDSVTQASQLLTAGATLFAQGAFKGPIGVISAIATIAGMVASFLALKSKVQEISGGFKDGGYTGNVGVNEVAGDVHGQEFVSNAKTTKKHRKLLEAMHSEDYSHLTIQDLSPLLSGTGVVFNKEVLQEIKVDQSKYNQSKNDGPERLIMIMEQTNKNINKFFQHYKNKPEEGIRPDGSRYIKKGDKIRIIKKK